MKLSGLVILLVVIYLMTACTVMEFSCSTGQYGPRAAVIYGIRAELDPTILQELSRLCSAEVEDDA